MIGEIITWNMQGGGTSDEKDITAWEQLLNEMNNSPNLKYACLQECSDIFELKEKGFLNITFKSPDHCVERDDDIRTATFTYESTNYYIAHHAFSKSSDTAGRCSSAILIKTEDDENACKLSITTRDKIGLRPMLDVSADFLPFRILCLHAPSGADSTASGIICSYLRKYLDEESSPFILGADFNIDIDDLKAKPEFTSLKVTARGTEDSTHGSEKRYDYFIYKNLSINRPITISELSKSSDHQAVFTTITEITTK